jgi:hypothetical protein
MSAYVIQRGDTLFEIAESYTGNGNRYNEILDSNPSITDPDVIVEGNVIDLPSSWSASTSSSDNLPAVTPKGRALFSKPALESSVPGTDWGTIIALGLGGVIIIGGAMYFLKSKSKVKQNPEEGETEAEDYEAEDYEDEDVTPGDDDEDESDR